MSQHSTPNQKQPNARSQSSFVTSRFKSYNSTTEIGGRWTASGASRHINILELEAAFFALQSFGDKITGAHIQVHLDNTTAVAYINNMGGSKSLKLNCLAIKIWDWSIQRDNWISCSSSWEVQC